MRIVSQARLPASWTNPQSPAPAPGLGTAAPRARSRETRRRFPGARIFTLATLLLGLPLNAQAQAQTQPKPEPRAQPQATAPEPTRREALATQGLPAERNFSYPWSWVWRATIRLLVVERGYVIDQQDPKSGFVLFHQAADEKNKKAALRGSIELIALDANNLDAGVRLLARVQNGGTHAAFTLLGALEQKIRREHGPPPVIPPPAKPEPKPPQKPGSKTGKSSVSGR